MVAALAGFGASAINAIAGGGTLISFPTLMGLGLSELTANATNAVALWPGSASGALGFQQHLAESKAALKALLPPTIIGSLSGSILLVTTPESAFRIVVPFLILLATSLLAFQPQIKSFAEKGERRMKTWQAFGLQLLVAVYGGYFGAGMGIMMLAVMSLYLEGEMHRLNLIKNWLAVVINFGASIVLLTRGLVDLQFGLAVMVGALFGGFFSAKLSLRVKSEALRRAIVIYGFGMSVFLLWRLVA
jgi:uncharacterized membrane protein YfcA